MHLRDTTASGSTFRSALDYESEDDLCRALQSQLSLESSDWVLRRVRHNERCSLSVQEELRRLQVLKSYQILDTDNEQALDDITESVRASFDVPWASVSLVDMGRMWIKSFERQDIPYSKQISRHDSFCSRAILQEGNSVLVVPDLLLDDRFKDSQLVCGQGPCFRFYAGAPLVSPEGVKLGTLC
jgi:GAF domain-containing protein